MFRKVIVSLFFGGLVIASCAAVVLSVRSETKEVVYEGVLWESDESETCTETKTYAASSTAETAVEGTARGETEPVFLMLDINSATAEQLCMLDGIGVKKAAEIIAYRESVGGFSDITDIMNVGGIAEKTFAAIREHIYVTAEYAQKHSEITVTQPVYTDDSVEIHEETPMYTDSADVYDEETHAETSTENTVDFPLDLNLATAKELSAVPAIDEKLAEDIVLLREKIQYFQNVRELLYVDGMTPTLFKEIEPYVFV